MAGSSTLQWQEGSGAPSQISGGPLPIGTARQVVCAKTGGSGTIYLDGVAELTASAGNPTTTGEFWIADNPDATGRYWAGFIGDVIVANRGWTAAEVKRLYDPATRWLLYDARPPVTYSFPNVLRTRAEVDPPTKAYPFAGYAPTIEASADTIIEPTAVAFSHAAQVPGIATGASVAAPAMTHSRSGQTPAAGTSALVLTPARAFVHQNLVPAVATGASVATPAGSCTTEGLVPAIGIGASVPAPAGAFTLANLAINVATGANVKLPLEAFLLAGVSPAVLARAWLREQPKTDTWARVAPKTDTWERL